MTPAELTAAREALGLSAAELGRALQLAGRDPGRTVRFWGNRTRPRHRPRRRGYRLHAGGTGPWRPPGSRWTGESPPRGPD